MSTVNLSSSTLNAELTDYAVGLYPEMAKTRLAEFIAPTVPVATVDGKYTEFDRGLPFSRISTRMGEDGDMPELKVNGRKMSYDIVPHGVKSKVNDFRKIAEAAGADLAEQARVKSLISHQLIAREFDVADAVAASASVADPTSYGKWFGTAGKDADIIAELDDIIVKLTENCGGVMMPNRMVIPLTLWAKMKNHPSIRERLQGLEAAAQLPKFASYLVNPAIDIRLGTICYNAGARGKEAKLTPIFGSSILVFNAEDTPTTEDFTFMKTFMLDNGDWQANGAVHSVRNELNNADIHYLQWAQDIRSTAAHAGMVINVK